MSDDLIDRLQNPNFTDLQWPRDMFNEAAARIEALEAENARLVANAKYDAELLVVYHQWCFKHGCAPSSSDLIAARAALAGEKKDG